MDEMDETEVPEEFLSEDEQQLSNSILWNEYYNAGMRAKQNCLNELT